VITHLAFYAGWPKAMSAMSVAKNIFATDDDSADDYQEGSVSSSTLVARRSSIAR
jgi:hypothetical protein